jgi:phosphate-selective porin OprO/OprP
MTYSAAAYRQEFGAIGQQDGADFGDGKYGFVGRMTFLPIYQNDGVQLLHVGASATWRKAENVDNAAGNQNDANAFVDFRARPLMRDAIGDYGTAFSNAGNLLPGNIQRIVDTGRIAAQSSSVIATELFYVCGPFSLQSEWAFAQVSEARPLGSALTPATRSFNGGYVQLSYFITGEHRTYDRRLGRLDSNYFTGPNTNFWLTRDENGGLNVGRGAWEAAVRWNYLNLNDGPIQGGVVDGVEVGLNWYLNPNLKIQFEYMTNNRFHLNPAGTPVGTTDGVVQGFGTRVHLAF